MKKIFGLIGLPGKFVRKSFPVVIDSILVICFTFALLSALYYASYGPSFFYKILIFVGFMLAITISIVLYFGLIYILIDIRDILEKGPRPNGGGATRPNPNPNPAPRAPRGEVTAGRGNIPPR